MPISKQAEVENTIAITMQVSRHPEFQGFYDNHSRTDGELEVYAFLARATASFNSAENDWINGDNPELEYYEVVDRFIFSLIESDSSASNLELYQMAIAAMNAVQS